jgi:transketolase
LRELDAPAGARAQLLADACRLNALYMIARAGSGHIGSSFSSLDIVTWLHLEELGARGGEDLYFSSKGHDAPGLYAVLIALEQLPFDTLHRLRQLDGLPGHPDIGTPGVVTNTGSLGMGISKAKGLALANRYSKKPSRVYVMTGDGELQEGQIWESLISAANRGWHVERANGHDFEDLSSALWRCQQVATRPQVIIADTIKGKGVGFMEHTSLDSDVAQYRFHSGAPNTALYRQAVEELVARMSRQTEALGVLNVQLDHAQTPERLALGSPQKLVSA